MFSQSYSSTSSSAFFPSSHALPGLSLSDLSSVSLNHQFLQSIPPSQAEPEAFKQNIQFALCQVARVHDLARNVLLATQHAYTPGNNPIQTAADMAELQHALHILVELLRHSGVGALLLHSPPPAAQAQPAEEEERQIAEMATAVQALFEKRKRLEESAGVVASLLAAEKDGRR